ncbi:MAG: hypothetical protein ACRD8W_02015 [Nitrososphaeraceae archaeon]
MIGLAIVLGLLLIVVSYLATMTEFSKTFGQSEEIRLQSIQTPEQKAEVESVKEQWLAGFNKLLNEFNSDE